MRKLIWLLIFIACWPVQFIAQSVFFESKIGGRWSDQASAVKEIGGDKIYVCGYSDSVSQNGLYDPVLLKLNRFGGTEWTKYFSSAEDDYAFSFSVLRDGKLIIIGEVNTGGPDAVDALLLKADTAGNIIWKKNFGGPGAQSLQFIDTTSDGNLIACGYAASPSGDNDLFVTKLDTSGNILWQKLQGGSQTDYGDAILEVPGGYVASAVTSSFGGGSTDGWLLRLNGNGDTSWTRTSGDQFAGGCQGVTILKTGDYILFGEEETFFGSGFNFWMAKYDDTGFLLWKKNFGGNGSDAIFSLVEDSLGNLIAAGYSNSFNFGAPLDLIVFKTDSSGNIIWKKTYGGSGVDIAYEMVPSVWGGYIITGVYKDPVLLAQYYVLHVDSTGGVLQDVFIPQNESGCTVFPIPSSGSITIDFPAFSGEVVTTLTDVSGNLICRSNLSADKKINVEGLPSGIYFLRIKTSDTAVVKKIIVSNE